MAHWKVIFELIEIVEAEGWDEAVDMAKDKACLSEVDDFHCYQLTDSDLEKEHNVKILLK